MIDESDISKEPMLEMFVFETNQLLEQLEELLLLSEKNEKIGTENINEIFRIMHTIKGSSAMMMFNNISSVAHSVEDLFYFIRENKPDHLDYSTLCDLILSASDFVKSEIKKIQSGNQFNDQSTDLYVNESGGEDEGQFFDPAIILSNRIKNYLSSINGNANELSLDTNSQNDKSTHKFYISSYNKKGASGQQKYTAKVYFVEDCQMENIRAYTIIHNLKVSSSEIFHRPAQIIEDNQSSDFIVQNGFDIYFSTNENEDEIRKLFDGVLFIKTYELNKVDGYLDEISDLYLSSSRNSKADAGMDTNSYSARESEDEKETSIKSLKQNLISVNVEKLDKLMDLVGEIVITESMVTRNPDLIGLQLDNFGKAARQLRKLNDELQDVVMSIRMIPIAATFNKMQRIVRDMGKKLSKEVQLTIIGEETEVDKNIIENLSDPLMHLIRNAMDHGIEDSEERKLKGKPFIGGITLEAGNTGGDVVISITDDGRGLNKDKILQKARKNGLINKAETELSDREIFSFILLPGFSTSNEVTEYSGRGVGMDVVKKNIDKVGGTVSVESLSGLGTTIKIKIPLTLAIIDGMEIAVGNSIYTLPTICIKESFRPEERELIIDPEGNEMMMIRGNCCPVVRLHKLFAVKTEITNVSKGIIIVVENDARTVCLFADQLLGEQQVVVKSLPKYLNKYKVKEIGVAGCTILGDGSISLILDAMGLINSNI